MSATITVISRQTKYAKAVLVALRQLNHATNLELLREVRKMYPEVSTTTVHRVSARLKERGVIGCAPKPTSGSERYDSNPEPHHHFMCVRCSRICDVSETSEARTVMEQLKELSGECAIAGTLTMRGICKKCMEGDI